MRILQYTTALLVLIFCTLPVLGQQSPEYVPGEVLVKFDPAALPEIQESIRARDLRVPALAALLEQHGFSGGEKIFRDFMPSDTIAISRTGERVNLVDVSRWYKIRVSPSADILTLVKLLSELPGVIEATPNHLYQLDGIFPNDPLFTSGLQWGLYNYSRPGKDIHAPAAWEKNKGRSDVIISVIDSGVDYRHPDLDPGDRSRVAQGYDYADKDMDPMDYYGHGTSVSGVLGAITDNLNKAAGVVWNTTIQPLKVSSSYTNPGSIIDDAAADGIDYARTHGSSIINMSFGKSNLKTVVKEAARNAYMQGLFLVASMGNDNTETTYYPAGFPWITAVSATNEFDRRVNITDDDWAPNYGNHIDVSAPGDDYYTLYMNNSYGPFSGTSCAAPMTTGVAGLILAESKDIGLNLTNDDVKHLLEVTADDVNASTYPGWDKYLGFGRINADRALTLINAPYTVTQATVTGGNYTNVWDSHTHTFYTDVHYGLGNSLSATGRYYGVKTYEVSGSVTFADSYDQPPYVWIRERSVLGWTAAQPNMQMPFVSITDVTTSGFRYKTYVFWVGSNELGQPINQYFPTSPWQVQIAYTVVGIGGSGTPGTPPPNPIAVSLSGTSTLQNAYSYGSWTATVTNAPSSTVQYDWYLCPVSYSQCQFMESHVTSSTSDSYAHSPLSGDDFNVKVVVTSGSQTDYDTYFVDILENSYYIAQDNKLAALDSTQAKTVGGSSKNGLSARAAGEPLPEKVELGDNYPNPFSRSTIIEFALPEPADVHLAIFDVMGREVARPADGQYAAGRHRVTIDASHLPSGTYFYRLTTEGFSQTKRLVVLR